jgi:UDP-N-acetylglucosamine--N-acetylmuramyl-(pentapeptide) pyrophosphoryl-undecaprenol N-acetylglucosamine transferase
MMTPGGRAAAGTIVWFAGGGTGGHLYPGLAIARALVREHPAAQPFFIGARRGIERDVLPREGFPFELLDLHPLYRPLIWRNWRTVRGAITAWRRLGALERPRLVVGTGGYASGLALAYATLRKIPYVEQVADSFPGLTARSFSRTAREVYLGYPEAERYLPRRNGTVLLDTGNPIEPPPTPRPPRAAARVAWGFPPAGGTVLLIFGGSQGARGLNAAVDAWLGRGLSDDLYVIWATGKANFDAHRARASARVVVRPYLSPIADAYAASDVALTRAGAMTTAELCAWGLPMILVPLPTAAADHQTANARALAAAGAAVHVPQSELTADRLERVVENVALDAEQRDALAAAARARGRPDAAQHIANRIVALLATG